MGTESSKGRAWFGKIYNKLEKILVEVDTFTSQSTLCLNSDGSSGWESVRSEPEESAEDCSCEQRDGVSSPSCKSPDDPPSHQKFDSLGNVQVEEQFKEDGLKENLSSASSSADGEIVSSSSSTLVEEYCDSNLKSATSVDDDEEPIVTDEESQITDALTSQKFSDGDPSVFPSEESGSSTESQTTQSSVESFGIEEESNDDSLEISTDDSNLNPIATKIPDVPVQDYVADTRSFNDVDLDDVCDSKSEVAQLDSKAFREDPSYVDDNALYAVRVRTKKLRSFKRKILDALTSKRRREKDYEQLPIWFGDAEMGSDLVTGLGSKAMASMIQEAEDSQWELL